MPAFEVISQVALNALTAGPLKFLIMKAAGKTA
jgi:hypothetical protein